MKVREYQVLGSQTLAELRDVLPCVSDRLSDGASHSSGFFFIEKVFYNDLRQPDNVDYSAYGVPREPCRVPWTSRGRC